MTEPKVASFEGWAVVEMFGHTKEVGYVTTEAYGSAVLFRCDTPELPEREYVLESPEYAAEPSNGTRWCPAGTKVKRPASPAKSRLIGPGAIYAITPCGEDTARRAIESLIRRPLTVLELPADAPKLLPGESGDIRIPESNFEDDEDGVLEDEEL